MDVSVFSGGISVPAAEQAADESGHHEPAPVDSVGKVSVSPDGMRAFINMKMPQNGGKTLTLSDIQGLINGEGIVYGMRALTINRLAEQPLYDRDVMIAEGTPPVKGKDGAIVYHVKISKDAIPREREDGTVDYKDLGLIENVAKDQLLVEKIPPELGVDGQTVLGKIITAQKGREIALPVGRNTYISEDGLFLRALIDGQCDYTNRKLNVLETYTVNGDVSISTGNINFVGNVVVTGNVATGYTVQAGGNIEIRGCVEGGVVIAGGNVAIWEGFHGMYKGEVIAGGDVRTKYIQAGRVQAGGLVESQLIMQSNIQTGDTIRLLGNRSVILGGHIVAKKLIDCQNIGGRNHPVNTVIEVGSDPRLLAHAREVQREEIALTKSLVDIDRVLVLFKQLERQNRLAPDKRDMMIRSANTRRTTSERLIALRNEDEEVKLKLAEEGYGTIIARTAIYTGVKIIIGPEHQTTSKQLDSCRVTRGEGGLIIAAL